MSVDLTVAIFVTDETGQNTCGLSDRFERYELLIPRRVRVRSFKDRDHEWIELLLCPWAVRKIRISVATTGQTSRSGSSSRRSSLRRAKR